MFRRAFLATMSVPSLGWGQASKAQPRIERAWFGPADRVHGHDALGSGSYPGRLHAAIRLHDRQELATLELPDEAAFEDGLVRLVDLDADHAPELLLVRASRDGGAAMSVFGVESRAGAPLLLELARSPSVGTGRWLNPVGAADFDGDGRQEVVAVLTPHIGGVLTLYRYEPPHLTVVAQERNVSNHEYGRPEQQLAAVVTRNGRPAVAIPDQSRRRLRFLEPTPGGAWKSAMPDMAFDEPIQRVEVADGERLQVQAGSRTWSINQTLTRKEAR